MIIQIPRNQKKFQRNFNSHSMAKIVPFRAVRPTKDKAAYVASRSYDQYSLKELNTTLHSNPSSFLHIINQGFKSVKKLSGIERFELVRKQYLSFLKKKVFLKDNKACFYLYQIEKKDFKCCGILAATSIAEYQSGIIKKHEETLEEREELFAEYLKTVQFKRRTCTNFLSR